MLGVKGLKRGARSEGVTDGEIVVTQDQQDQNSDQDEANEMKQGADPRDYMMHNKRKGLRFVKTRGWSSKSDD